ncbi:hypothetical protein Bca52824_011241 [Brassica carinata]|uniref:Uncharacterized protein n=1 Tax=Brassica carinata TaxID=52824 RepID=A0A8X7WHP6_BRACI|nr:hypothetical protein Bca52824_011241 [Brassica carinata]
MYACLDLQTIELPRVADPIKAIAAVGSGEEAGTPSGPPHVSSCLNRRLSRRFSSFRSPKSGTGGEVTRTSYSVLDADVAAALTVTLRSGSQDEPEDRPSGSRPLFFYSSEENEAYSNVYEVNSKVMDAVNEYVLIMERGCAREKNGYEGLHRRDVSSPPDESTHTPTRELDNGHIYSIVEDEAAVEGKGASEKEERLTRYESRDFDIADLVRISVEEYLSKVPEQQSLSLPPQPPATTKSNLSLVHR